MRQIRTFVRAFLGLLLLAMVLMNVANAAGRYIFQKAIPGSDEVLIFAMVWLVFVGACLVTLDRGHLSFDMLPRALGQYGGRILHSVTCLAISLLTGYVAIQSWAVLTKLLLIGQKSMATEIPMVIPHAAVLISLSLISLISLIYAFMPAEGRSLSDRAERNGTRLP